MTGPRTGHNKAIAARHYARTRRLEDLLMAIFSHPTTDEIVRERIKAEFYNSSYKKGMTTRLMNELRA